MTKTFAALAVVSLILFGLLPRDGVRAQSVPTAPAQNPPAEPAPPAADPLGRSTPHGTAEGLTSAVAAKTLDRAAEYLEASGRSADRGELARKLWVVLDRKLLTSLDQLSQEPGGDVNDGVADRDSAGLIESPSGSVEVFLDRVQRGQGRQVWLFSSSLLQEIPRLYEELQPPWIEQFVPEPLRTTRWQSIQLYRWIAGLLLIPLIYVAAGLGSRLLAASLTPVVQRLLPSPRARTLASRGPLRLLVLAVLFYGSSFFGQSLAARQTWTRVAETLATVALCWLSLRIVDLISEMSLERLQRIRRQGDVALVKLLHRLSKVAMVIVAALVLLYLANVDLTAALTGLGVGGLAIGFGAQKTIENLFGGITVISDKPVNVGDVCKVGDVTGTVEDIGIRSTRIRTVDHTVVSVPNGQLAAMILENFAQRDRLRFHHTVGLGAQTTTAQLRNVLAQIRRLLDADPKVEPRSAHTRLIRVSGTSLDLEIFAYVLESEQSAFLAIQEELLLGIMEIIEASGTAFAAPLAPGRVLTT